MTVWRSLFKSVLIPVLLLMGEVLSAQRLVSLSPAVTETLFHIGAGKKLVGRSSVCNYPEEAKRLPVAGDYASFNTEEILALKPDAVITNDLAPASRGILPKLGIRCETMKIRTMEEYLNALKQLGEIASCRESAEKERQRTVRLLQSFREKKYPVRPRVIWVIWHRPVMLAGEGSFPDTLLKLAGGTNVCAGTKAEYFQCSDEWILAHEPDYVIWTVHGVPMPDQGGLSQLRAVREKRVLFPDPDKSLRPGPRMFESIQQLSRDLHPAK